MVMPTPQPEKATDLRLNAVVVVTVPVPLTAQDVDIIPALIVIVPVAVALEPSVDVIVADAIEGTARMKVAAASAARQACFMNSPWNQLVCANIH